MRPQSAGRLEQKCIWILESREAWQLLPREEGRALHARCRERLLQVGWLGYLRAPVHGDQGFRLEGLLIGWYPLRPLPILGARPGQSFLRFEVLVSSAPSPQPFMRSHSRKTRASDVAKASPSVQTWLPGGQAAA